MKTKHVLIICISVVIAAAVVSASLVAIKLFKNPNGNSITVDTTTSSSASGTTVVLKIVGEEPTDEQLDIIKSVFRERLDAAGYTSSRISSNEKGKITVVAPNAVDGDSLTELLVNLPKLEFKDADGNVVIDGATDIKEAKYEYGKTDSTGSSTHHVTVTFNSDARKKFAEATKKAASAANGKNYIAIVMEDEVISQPRVSSMIDSDSCVITGDFTAETAKALADQINVGVMPFTFEPSTYTY